MPDIADYGDLSYGHVLGCNNVDISGCGYRYLLCAVFPLWLSPQNRHRSLKSAIGSISVLSYQTLHRLGTSFSYISIHNNSHHNICHTCLLIRRQAIPCNHKGCGYDLVTESLTFVQAPEVSVFHHLVQTMYSGCGLLRYSVPLFHHFVPVLGIFLVNGSQDLLQRLLILAFRFAVYPIVTLLQLVSLMNH